MSADPFAALKPQAAINLRADAYGETALRLSRLAALTTRHRRDVAYGPDPAQVLDIYMPDDDIRRDLPVLVAIHGGGWTHGYKEWMGLNAPPIVAAPALFVSLSHRLAHAHPHPAAFEDCLSALGWIRRHIADFGGSPDRLFLAGHSAGGHLAALVALRRDCRAAAGLPDDAIKACFPFSGQYDLAPPGPDGLPTLLPSARSLIAEPADADAASPIRFAAGNGVPFFVTWAENDNPATRAQGPRFVEALAGQPGRVDGYEFPLFDHFWIHVDQQRPANPWTRTVVAWMTGDPATAPVFRP